MLLQNDYKDMVAPTFVHEEKETRLGDFHSADTLCHQVFMDGGKLSSEARKLNNFPYGIAKINLFLVVVVQFIVYGILALVAFG